MKFLNKKLVAIVASGFLFLIPIASFAVTYTCDPTKTVCNPIGASTIDDLIRRILEGAIKIGIPVIAWP